MKGILLAGGTGTRLHPLTQVTSKQLLPVYDKPMVYYPLSTLMQAGIRDILLISTPHDIGLYEELLGDGRQWGIKLSYAQQAAPQGIAQAFLIGEDFIGNDAVCLILGDNIIYGHGLAHLLQASIAANQHATIFGYYVKDPQRYGVIAFDAQDHVIDIVEKPSQPPSHYAAIGLYLYDNQVVNMARQLTPSARGELEITDISRHYLAKRQLKVIKLSRGTAWLDTGTQDSLLEAANFIKTLENRQGLNVGSPEEAAWCQGYIDAAQLKKLAQRYQGNRYGAALLNLLAE